MGEMLEMLEMAGGQTIRTGTIVAEAGMVEVAGMVELAVVAVAVAAKVKAEAGAGVTAEAEIEAKTAVGIAAETEAVIRGAAIAIAMTEEKQSGRDQSPNRIRRPSTKRNASGRPQPRPQPRPSRRPRGGKRVTRRRRLEEKHAKIRTAVQRRLLPRSNLPQRRGRRC